MSWRHSAKSTNWRKAKKTQPSSIFSHCTPPFRPPIQLAGRVYFPRKTPNSLLVTFHLARWVNECHKAFDSCTEPSHSLIKLGRWTTRSRWLAHVTISQPLLAIMEAGGGVLPDLRGTLFLCSLSLDKMNAKRL